MRTTLRLFLGILLLSVLTWMIKLVTEEPFGLKTMAFLAVGIIAGIPGVVLFTGWCTSGFRWPALIFLLSCGCIVGSFFLPGVLLSQIPFAGRIAAGLITFAIGVAGIFAARDGFHEIRQQQGERKWRSEHAVELAVTELNAEIQSRNRDLQHECG